MFAHDDKPAVDSNAVIIARSQIRESVARLGRSDGNSSGESKIAPPVWTLITPEHLTLGILIILALINTNI